MVYLTRLEKLFRQYNPLCEYMLRSIQLDPITEQDNFGIDLTFIENDQFRVGYIR